MYDATADDDVLSASKLPIASRHYVIAAALGSCWFYADGHAFFPVGILVGLVWIGRTFDVSFGRSLKHAWRVALSAVAASALGLVFNTGVVFGLAAHAGQVVASFGARVLAAQAILNFTF